MRTIILISLAVSLLVLLIYLFVLKGKKNQANDSSDQEVDGSPIPKGIPKGKEEEFQLAIDPCSDGKPLMYTLTTCGHCHHLHDFLNEKNVEHHQIFVDHYDGQARQAIRDKVYKFNPRKSFPVMVFPCGSVITGFRKSEICKVLGINSN